MYLVNENCYQINFKIKGDVFMSLYAISKNKRCVVENMPSLELLSSLGLRKGLEIGVKSRQPMGGPIVIEIGRRSIAIAKDIASSIVVKEV